MSRSSVLRTDALLTLLALCLVVAIGLLAASPFFLHVGLPAATDAELHIYRIAELGYSLRAGNLYPRWAPDFFHGYGYPIFNYYAPLTYHLGNWLTLGHPERAAAGARLVFILAHVLGALGAYKLGTLFYRRSGGVLAALSFTTAPYLLLINTHVRGDLPESFALAFVPWALWGWELVWRRGSPFAMGAAVVATAVSFLSHNLTGLTLVVLVAGLGLWRLLFGRADHSPAVQRGSSEASRSRSPYLGRAVLTALIFVLITAFFWLPFLAERRFIQLDVAGDGHYDFRNHFVSLRELLAWLGPIDRRASAADVPMTVGMAPVIVALIGTLLAVVHRRFRQIGFYVVASVGLFWMMTPNSQILWELLPGIEFYQFPWRFLGPLAALLAPLGGGLVLACVPFSDAAGERGAPVSSWRRWIGYLLCGGAVSVLFIGAVPGLYPPPWESGFGFITPEDIVQAELEGRWRGTTSTNDFVPESVEMIPGPQADLLASYAHPPVDRVNRYTVPEGAQVEVVPSAPWVNHFAVQAEKAFKLRLYLFDFPGWVAYLDGQPIEIEIAHPEGFITVPVPAGMHEVVVRFGSTPVRGFAWIISGAGGLLLLLLPTGVGKRTLALLARRRAATSSIEPTSVCAVSERFDRGRGVSQERALLLTLTGFIALIVLVKVLVFDPWDGFAIETPIGQAPSDVMAQAANFGDEITLLGFDITPQRADAGQMLDVKLIWQAQRPLSVTYQSFVHLVYPEGKILGQSDHLNPGGFPTNLWPLDRYIIDHHKIRIPADVDAGAYLISVGLYDLETGHRIPVRSAACGYRPDSVVLCNIVSLAR